MGDLNSSQAKLRSLNLICFWVIFCINLLELCVKLQAKEVAPHRQTLRAHCNEKENKSIIGGPPLGKKDSEEVQVVL